MKILFNSCTIAFPLVVLSCGGPADTQPELDAAPPPLEGIYFTADAEVYRFTADGVIESSFFDGTYERLPNGNYRFAAEGQETIEATVTETDGGISITATIAGTRSTSELKSAAAFKPDISELEGTWWLHEYVNIEPQFGAEEVTVDAGGTVRSDEGAPYCRIAVGGDEVVLFYRNYAQDGSFVEESKRCLAFTDGRIVSIGDAIHRPAHSLVIERKP